jgi:CRP-like cAMP-binding protein
MAGTQTSDLAEFLTQLYLCESLTRREVQTLLEYLDEVVFRKNAIIADIGEVGEALYLVVAGEATLAFQSGGETVEFGHARRGELIGEMSFFDREPRSVRLVAKSADTRLLRLSRPMYLRLRVEHPFIAVNLLEQVIVSLDGLFRRVSQDMAAFARYMTALKRAP